MMASHSSVFIMLALTAACLPYSSAAVTIPVSDKLVDTICTRTQNPEFCRTTLHGFPATKGANEHKLVAITTSLAFAQASSIRNNLFEPMQKEKDAVTNDEIIDCLTDYSVIEAKLLEAIELYSYMKYKGMIKLVNDVLETSKQYQDHSKKLPSRLSHLQGDYQKMVWLNDIALVTLHALLDS